MFRSITVCGLIALASCSAALAQKADLKFEVASIKPAAPPTMSAGGGMQIRVGRGGGPGTTDPGRITVNNQTLRDLIANAYNVKRYQVSGPDWLDAQRFDIVAKVPEGATKEDVAVMWQNLLKERFGMELHHETKDLPMYALVVAKGGPKLKESEADPAAAPAPPLGGPDGGPPPAMTAPKMGKDGMPELPANMRRPGAMMMMMMPGRMRMSGTAVLISALTETLGRQLDKPVVDQTGLTKAYDITLDFSPEGLSMMRGMPMPPPGAMMAPPPSGGGMAGGGGGGGSPSETVRAPEGGEAPTLAVALQEQLGLKMESKKGPVDLLVIDHMEKQPTEN